MKKSFVATVAVVAVSAGVLFSACKKESEGVLNQSVRQQKNLTELKAYEYYTPDEEVVYNKLAQIMESVNNPNVIMPNMELKEAVWYLEAFFNIGVCAHQEHAMDSVIGTKEYAISVPIISGGNGTIHINGEALTIHYRNLLDKIITEVCSEYTINFGDMYVDAINTNEVILGLTILYGHKADEDFSVHKIASYAHYPGTLLSPISLWFTPYPYELPLRDPGMEALLNQETMLYPVGIVRVKDYITPSVPIYSEPVKNSYIKWLYPDTWEQYGTGYRNDIHDNLYLYYNALPSNPLQVYAPFYAFCEVHLDNDPFPYDPSVYIGKAFHKFGLEYVHHVACLAPDVDWGLIYARLIKM